MVIFLLSLEQEKEELFKEKELSEDNVNKTYVSTLTQLLQDSLNKPGNAFLEYAKYNGEVSYSSDCECIKIHLQVKLIQVWVRVY